MYFDQLGKQHVSRRRKPSPLRNKRSASFDANFNQQVWPRFHHAGDDESAPETRRSERTHSEKAPSAGTHSAGMRSAGFTIPPSWIKNLVLAAGILVIGLIGTNWDSISKTFRLQEVSTVTLQDSAAYQIMDAAYEPLVPRETVYSPVETASASVAVRQREEMPLNLTETFYWSEYEVKHGDTISEIASKYSISSGSIIAFNSIKEAWNIRAGRKLKIPNMDGIPYTVEKNDSLSKIAARMKVPQNAILDANEILSDTILPGQILFIPGARMDASEFSRAYRRDAARKADTPMVYPLSGRITSGFGWREDPVRPKPGEKTFHKAVDIAGKMGDSVKAAMNGTVLHVDNNPNLGNFIILKHGEYQTVYAHLSAYSVKTGDTVKQGQEIGKVGETGYTTGPHLHFEVFHNGNRVNPLDLLK